MHTGDRERQAELQRKLARVREEYARQVPARLDILRQTWRAYLAKKNSEYLNILFKQVHSLKGSAATMGFPTIGEAAARLHESLYDVRGREEPLTQAQELALDGQVQALLAQASAVPDQGHGVEADDVPVPEPSGVKVLLVEDDELVARELALQIGHYGYHVVRSSDCQDHEQIKNLIREERPAVMIVDIVMPDNVDGGLDLAAHLRSTGDDMPRVVFLSAREDLQARLRAVRAGGEAYFIKPVDVQTLVDKLDQLSSSVPETPYKVLIIDNSMSVAQYCAAILRGEGMQVRVLQDPLKVLDAIAEFTPEIILLDMYMPDCDGRELAAVIRQEAAYVSIPIIFLSSEKNIDRQLAAMWRGGDDFLIKPIHPEHLAASVRMRVARSRTLRSYMVRDSLTGLYNHTKTKELLDLELIRANRSGGHVVFVMIDIDHFKRINDAYGHPVGDGVIKNLSRLLQQRLRKTDIVGRYGGEEFAIILNDTTLEQAQELMEDIRVHFFRLIQRAADTEFHASFSCGLAAFPDYEDAAALNEAADQALYEAKAGGRNQVVVRR